MINLGNITITVVANIRNFVNDTQNAVRMMQNLGREVRAFGRGMREVAFGLGLVGAAITAGFKSIVEQGVALDTVVTSTRIVSAELRKLQNDTAAYNAKLTQLREGIQQLGKDSQFSSREIGEAAQVLLSAGFKIEEIFPDNNKASGLAQLAVELAAFENIKVDKAADLLKIAANSLGFSQKQLAANARSLANALAVASSSTGVTVRQLAASLSLGGSKIKDTGIKFQEAIAAISVVGQAGRRGTAGGSAIQALVQDLADLRNSAAAVQQLRSLGLEAADLNPFRNSLQDIVERLGRVKNASKENEQAISALVQKIGTRALGPLINQSEKFKEVLEAINQSGNTLGDALTLRLQSIEVKFKLFTSTVETLQEQLFELIKVDLGTLLDQLKAFIDGVLDFVNRNPEFVKGLLEIVAGVGAVSLALSAVLLVVGTFTVALGHFLYSLDAITEATKKSAAMQAIWNVATAAGAQVAAFFTNPLGTMRQALVAMTGALATSASTIKVWATALANSSLGSFVKSLTLTTYAMIKFALSGNLVALSITFVAVMKRMSLAIQGFGLAIKSAIPHLTVIIVVITAVIAAISLLVAAFPGISRAAAGFGSAFVSGFVAIVGPAIEFLIESVRELLADWGLTFNDMAEVAKAVGYFIGQVLGGIIAGFVYLAGGLLKVIGALSLTVVQMIYGKKAAQEWAKANREAAAASAEAAKEEERRSALAENMKVHLQQLDIILGHIAKVKANEEFNQFMVNGRFDAIKFTMALAEMGQAIHKALFTDAESKLKYQIYEINQQVETLNEYLQLTAIEMAKAIAEGADEERIKQFADAIAYAQALLADLPKLREKALADAARKTQSVVSGAEIGALKAQLEAEGDVVSAKTLAIRKKIFDLEQKEALAQNEQKIDNEVVGEVERQKVRAAFAEQQRQEQVAFANEEVKIQEDRNKKIKQLGDNLTKKTLKDSGDKMAAAREEAREIEETALEQVKSLKLVGDERQRILDLAKKAADETIKAAQKEVDEEKAREDKKEKKELLKQQKQQDRNNTIKEELGLENAIVGELGKQARTVGDLLTLMAIVNQLEMERESRAQQSFRFASGLQRKIMADQNRAEEIAARGGNTDRIQEKIRRNTEKLALAIGFANKDLQKAGVEGMDTLFSRVGLEFFNFSEGAAKVADASAAALERMKQQAAETAGTMENLANAAKMVADGLLAAPYGSILQGLLSISGGFEGATANAITLTYALQQLQAVMGTFSAQGGLGGLGSLLGAISGALGNPLGGSPNSPLAGAINGAPTAGTPVATTSNSTRTFNDSRNVNILVHNYQDANQVNRQIGRALSASGFAAEQI